MSLQTALNRARYRHLDRLHEIAVRHYNRSRRLSYIELADRIADRMNLLLSQCHFR